VPKKTQSDSEDRLLRAQEQFILEWGRMSSSWGINRTMAQIHALLFISAEPLSVDEIMQRLLISRGNASMSLRDLMDWGIVRRFRRPGERKDTYSSDTDPWQMFARVVRERKRRELDPTARAIRECIAMLPDPGETREGHVFSERLTGLLEVFDLLDAVYRQVLSTDTAFFDTVETFREQDAEKPASKKIAEKKT
jgi:DNA-binding transcriptional regulator GbsR (MarR family)